MRGTSALARRLRPAQIPRTVMGQTLDVPASGLVKVDLGDRVRTVRVPSSVRGLTNPGMTISIAVQGNSYIAAGILTDIPVPVVVDPSTGSVSVLDDDTLSSGNYDFLIGDNDWNAVRAYTRDNAAVTRALAGDLNNLRTAVNQNATQIDSVMASSNSNTAKVAEIANALRAQGLLK